MYELRIQNRGITYLPVIEGSVTWETSRMGTPGKLAFNVLRDDIVDFQEGNPVSFIVDGKGLFFGFVFTKERDKEQIIKVTAYDQLRYLKNKDTYVYAKKKASDVVKMIADDFRLNTGIIADTGHVIPGRIEDDKTLFDIIYNALDVTLMSTGRLYVLYDNFGKLTLQNVENMKVPGLVIGDGTAQNFSYKTDIDSDTYNKIKLSKENESTGKRDIYIAQDGSNMNAWGVLQYYEQTDALNPKAKAEAMLKLKNKKSKTLQVKDCLGDISVRAGTSIMTMLKDIGDISVNQYMLVERCEHVFANNEHFMTLDLRGDI